MIEGTKIAKVSVIASLVVCVRTDAANVENAALLLRKYYCKNPNAIPDFYEPDIKLVFDGELDDNSALERYTRREMLVDLSNQNPLNQSLTSAKL